MSKHSKKYRTALYWIGVNKFIPGDDQIKPQLNGSWPHDCSLSRTYICNADAL